jgi:formamidopyrimidine-DNA glycosylase
LLDQSIVSGLGNIYANEALFRAGIRPTAAGARLGRVRVERLAQVIPGLLQEAIRWCGTTFSDYRDGDDRAGGFQQRLAVYGREGLPCRRCGAMVRRLTQGGRGSFFCPHCQSG